jgi:hypothetical protein
MQLGKKSTTVDYLKQMQDEGEVVELPSAPSASAGSAAGSAVKARPEGPTEPVHLLIEEKMSVTLERDGGIATVTPPPPTHTHTHTFILQSPSLP